MMGQRKHMRNARAGCSVAALGAALLVSGCGSTSGVDLGGGVGDRFSQLFGGGSANSSGTSAQLVGTPPSAGLTAGQVQDNCPEARVRDGASTLAIGLPGKQASGADLRYQVTITRIARDCTLVGGQIQARIGVQGRVIVGPAGAPASVDIPLRIAVVEDTLQPKAIASKFYRTGVSLNGQENVPFSFVAEDVMYPVPAPGVADSYVFYVGFDPEGGRVQPPRKGRKSGA